MPPRVLAAFALKAVTASSLLALGLAHAQAPAPAAAPASPPAAAPGAGAAPGTPPGTPRPHKDVIKDAKEIPGYFKIYQKDEKTWLEIKPEQLDKPFFFSINIPRSVGERNLYGGQMLGPWNGIIWGSQVGMFKKIGNQVQLIAKNTEFYAKPGTPQAQFVSESFSDSLLASAPAASAPHPESKAFLVEANALLFNDIAGYATNIEFAYRMPFALDKANSSISRVTNNEMMTSVQVNIHYAVPKIAPPPLTPPPMPVPPPSAILPDPRSLFVGFQYNFMPLPADPMPTRVADERLGHFFVSAIDFTDEVTPKRREQFITRWRLEKKDPSAALSEPKKPVVYWLDKNVPEKYRKSVTDGILEWNKAFEKIGFKNAIQARQQTDKDDFDTMDAQHSSIRWFTGNDVGFAIGPSAIDPRTGEILDADIGMSDVFGRGARRSLVEDFSKPAEQGETLANLLARSRAAGSCGYMAESARELHFAMDLLEARGVSMDSPEADAVAQAYVKDVIMHEVGHTLGFMHNYRSSTVYTQKQLLDPTFTKVNSLAGSVMEYTPFNLALKGEKQGEYVSSTLGPYDYWAVEYAYRPIDPANEKVELAKIAARSTEPQLAYANDEDAGYGNILIGIDPDVNRWDLGADPLEYYKRRMQLSRELWDRLQALELKPGESYERLTRSFGTAFQQLAGVAPLAAKYVGGVKHLRDRAGSGRALYEPTPVARQREALKLITDGLLKVDSFKFKPDLLKRIAIDHFARPMNPDVSPATAVLGVQRAVLNQLLADHVAKRLIDSQDKVADASKAMKLSEVYDTIQGAVWSELKAGTDISPMRRNLQREHLTRVVNALIKPAPTTPADAKALQRENANALAGLIRAASGGKALSKEARAHLNESLNTLSEALKAPMTRTGA